MTPRSQRGFQPIADYAFLSDRNSTALIARDGSVDWLCMPRFDSSTSFGRILDLAAGHWTMAPSDPAEEITRRYVGPSLVLETTHDAANGTIVVTDALIAGDQGDPHAIGQHAPHVLARVVRCVRGEVEMTSEFVPRIEYALTTPMLHLDEDTLHTTGGADKFQLTGSDNWQLDTGSARLTFVMRAGDERCFALQWRSISDEPREPWNQERTREAVNATLRAWSQWDDHHAPFEGPYVTAVDTSTRVLQGLNFARTGASIAAATTSLTESVSNGRTWDYRYAWLRDCAMTTRALYIAACPDEACSFFTWAMNAATNEHTDGLQIVYGVGGERALFEHELEHLSGWRDSGPVRVGNDAWTQQQHDVYGELFDAAWLLRAHMTPFHPAFASFLAGLADRACEHWNEPDHGMWEFRGTPRHFVSSKAMCWVAVDRAERLCAEGALEVPDEQRTRWRRCADAIHAELLEQGWNEGVGAFTQSFGSDEMDASALFLVLYDVLPRDDPRLRSTVEAVERELSENGLIMRYRCDDGLDGTEGAFVACSFWLAQAWARLGEPERARGVFERALAHGNDLGLFAEELDPTSGEQLGNFPQAFSHTSLINAAWAIGEAERDGVPYDVGEGTRARRRERASA